MTFDINVIFNNFPEIVSGAWLTIVIWIVTTPAAAALGFLVAVARRFGGVVPDKAFGMVIAVLRGTRS